MKVNRCSRRLGVAVLSLSLVAGGCSRAGGSPAASDATAATAAPASTDSAQPTATAEPSAIETRSGASPEPVPTESSTPEPAMAEPPAASVAVEGGDPVVGQLGTFTWENGGSGAPWLNGSPIHVGSGERFALTLAGPLEIAEWSVSRVMPGNRDGTGALAMEAGSGWPVLFDAPPSGTWSVQVKVRFANDRGDALYYWMIDVD